MFVLTNSPKEFIPLSQKDETLPLTFIVIPPTRHTVLEFQETLFKSLSQDNEGNEITQLPLSDIMDIFLTKCVTGWKNVFDDKGTEIPFTLENFNSFNNAEILTELYQFIKELSESTEKN